MTLLNEDKSLPLVVEEYEKKAFPSDADNKAMRNNLFVVIVSIILAAIYGMLVPLVLIYLRVEEHFSVWIGVAAFFSVLVGGSLNLTTRK